MVQHMQTYHVQHLFVPAASYWGLHRQISKSWHTNQPTAPPVRATHLDGQGGQDGLGVDQVGVAQVVETTLLEDGGTSLRWHKSQD
jgi:hypothetical protein